MSVEIVIADVETVCYRCAGVIPPGHRYWLCTDHGFSLLYTEHTNCELYTVEALRQRHFQTRREKDNEK